MVTGQPYPDPETDPTATPEAAADAQDLRFEEDGNPLAEEQDTDAQPEGADDDLLARIEQLQNENAQLRDRVLHALADVENQRRRHERERGEAGKYAIGNFARELLVVADQLHMATAAVSQDQREENKLLNTMLVGVEATARTLGDVMGQAGIKQMEPLGQPFDPNFHEVMAEAPGTGQAAGTVVQVIQHGYMIHDRLLRPARVIVAKGGEADSGPAHSIDQSV